MSRMRFKRMSAISEENKVENENSLIEIRKMGTSNERVKM